MKPQLVVSLLLLCFLFNFHVRAQLPSEEEVMSLLITQKKASDSKDDYPFIPAPGTKPKIYPGHYTSLYNEECMVTGSFLQGRDIKQVVLLLYKAKDGYWKNGCWYYDNYYRLKIRDLNRDSILELLLETKINSGNRSYGSYKILSLINLTMTVWYQNETFLGFDPKSVSTDPIGKEITRDVKVTIIDSVKTMPCEIKERTISGILAEKNESSGSKLDYRTSYAHYKFIEHRFIRIQD